MEHKKGYDAEAEIEQIKAELRDEEERAARRTIIEKQRLTLPSPNRAGLIDIGPSGSLGRADGVVVNGLRFHDELRLATGWGAR